MNQRVPQVSKEDVARIAKRDFAPEVVPLANSLLAEYTGPELCRVQLAAIKLAAGDIDHLKHLVQQASSDYRDALAWAEYPRYLQIPFHATKEDKAAAIAQDWAEYQAWLEAT